MRSKAVKDETPDDFRCVVCGIEIVRGMDSWTTNREERPCHFKCAYPNIPTSKPGAPDPGPRTDPARGEGASSSAAPVAEATAETRELPVNAAHGDGAPAGHLDVMIVAVVASVIAGTALSMIALASVVSSTYAQWMIVAGTGTSRFVSVSGAQAGLVLLMVLLSGAGVLCGGIATMGLLGGRRTARDWTYRMACALFGTFMLIVGASASAEWFNRIYFAAPFGVLPVAWVCYFSMSSNGRRYFVN